MLFGDSSFLYAVTDPSDAYHAIALEIAEEAFRQHRPIAITIFVLAEVHALLLHRLGRHAAAQWLRNAYDAFITVRPNEDDEGRACEIIFGYADKDFPFTDAIPFAVTERLGITVALSLDKHFVQYGKFTVVPPQVPKLTKG